MATINFVTPEMGATQFTGGAWCLMRYAGGLSRRGHSVNVIPILPSHYPEWAPDPPTRFLSDPPPTVLSVARSLSGSVYASAKAFSRRDRALLGQRYRSIVGDLARLKPMQLDYAMMRAVSLQYMRGRIPESDATIATSYETAFPVSMYGTGRLFYFAQHYEPLFKSERLDPALAERDARASYHLGLKIIANSTWLQSTLREVEGIDDVEICTNAVDLDIFDSQPRGPTVSGRLSVISYGGRQAEWKGFREMAEGVRRARSIVGSENLHWSVYGTALLPPDNEVASYVPLGFLDRPSLAKAYQDNDVLLSASWYESFPLFPIEAMASGLAVITTKPGAEDYAVHERTAHIVDVNNPTDIADALVRLARDEEYRLRIAEGGEQASGRFTWDRSISRFEGILLEAGVPAVAEPRDIAR